VGTGTKRHARIPSWPSERFPRPRGRRGGVRELIDPYGGELQLHRYRILGSVQDAEDLLQETLSAMRGFENFEGFRSARNGAPTASRARSLRTSASVACAEI
jgi:DNA-directed RNA polymerase specialized sigma24 family protein